MSLKLTPPTDINLSIFAGVSKETIRKIRLSKKESEILHYAILLETFKKLRADNGYRAIKLDCWRKVYLTTINREQK